jgi:predicted RNase H-like HicB family nuclease
MKKFTAILHRGEPAEGGFWATCLEVPGANGQGETRGECLENLTAALRDLLELNREEAMANDPEAEQTDLILS